MTAWSCGVVVLIALGIAGPALADTPRLPLSFTRDVIPVLTKTGCNAGACHGLTDDHCVEEIYLATYSRRPATSEWATIHDLIAGASSRKEAFEDLLWTLLNSPEFAFPH